MIDYSPYDREQLVKLLWNRDRMAATSREHWVRAAKAALAGDPRELRNRVELAEAGPVTLTNGDDEWRLPDANGEVAAAFEAKHAAERVLRFLTYPVDPSIKERGWDCKTDRESVEHAMQILRGEE